MRVRLLLCAAVLGLGLVYSGLAGRGTAADDKDVKEDIDKVAGELAKDDMDTAKKDAEALGKKGEVEDLMNTFRLRTKKGFGVGSSGTFPANQDGVEAKVMGLAKKVNPADLDNADQIAQAGYRAAAVALAISGKSPVDKAQGEKSPEKWKGWAEQMNKAALDMAKEAKGKNEAGLKTAASKLNKVCNDCHGVFRD